MNTTSYLSGKAEFSTSTSYKKTWTEKKSISFYSATYNRHKSYCISIVNFVTEKFKGLYEVISPPDYEVINTAVFKSAFSNPQDLNSLKQAMTAIPF